MRMEKLKSNIQMSKIARHLLRYQNFSNLFLTIKKEEKERLVNERIQIEIKITFKLLFFIRKVRINLRRFGQIQPEKWFVNVWQMYHRLLPQKNDDDDCTCNHFNGSKCLNFLFLSRHFSSVRLSSFMHV